jgi:hypothetical protein
MSFERIAILLPPVFGKRSTGPSIRRPFVPEAFYEWCEKEDNRRRALLENDRL